VGGPDRPHGRACSGKSPFEPPKENAMVDTPQFAEMPESVRVIIKSNIEQAKKAFDTFIASAEKMIASMDMPDAARSEGLKALSEKIAEFTKSNAEANFRFAAKLAEARQFMDVIELQNSYVREQMENFTRQINELRELTTSVMADAVQTAAANAPKMPGA
jgi:hypothetical protein